MVVERGAGTYRRGALKRGLGGVLAGGGCCYWVQGSCWWLVMQLCGRAEGEGSHATPANHTTGFTLASWHHSQWAPLTQPFLFVPYRRPGILYGIYRPLQLAGLH